MTRRPPSPPPAVFAGASSRGAGRSPYRTPHGAHRDDQDDHEASPPRRGGLRHNHAITPYLMLLPYVVLLCAFVLCSLQLVLLRGQCGAQIVHLVLGLLKSDSRL